MSNGSLREDVERIVAELRARGRGFKRREVIERLMNERYAPGLLGVLELLDPQHEVAEATVNGFVDKLGVLYDTTKTEYGELRLWIHDCQGRNPTWWHIDDTTLEVKLRFEKDLRGQGTKMIARADTIRRYALDVHTVEEWKALNEEAS